MSSTTSHSKRSSISPLRSRKPSPSPSPKSSFRPVTPSSTTSSRPPCTSPVPAPNTCMAKENVTVTVRFRPLSQREVSRGDEVAWYADGDCTVRNEYNPNVAYGFDRVFGPVTTTRHVYDVAALHVVSGAMQGINGTVFAYGVTSSGKTHTMHGEQKSPGIIPLAVKDVFGIIQETPDREFLLRISYLEIYNEVINDLLDPTGQNLKIREDSQGIFVEGIKEEVVLSPAHALSLIATGEEHRHVGSNNFNLLSSRSHTIFTLTIESSVHEGNHGEEDVTVSQLHLIDLAGSESSKAETTGLRRKEGSYINKSLLTLGTVISKLTDGKATHIPYRDSKLTRLLQSSLSGNGHISLICTVTPASSSTEETQTTLKFAHRSKHVEVKAAQNKVMDETSLIKKYQREITNLKQELQQLKHGVSAQEDLANMKLQLEASQVELQSRLEEEEQAKAALTGRIQRLTKLILVSTKNTKQSNIQGRTGRRWRHSFGEDELAYLPDSKREYAIDDGTQSYNSELSVEGRDDTTNLNDFSKYEKRSKKRSMLGWFKSKKSENVVGGLVNGGSEKSVNRSPASCSKSLQEKIIFADTNSGQRKSASRWNGIGRYSVAKSFPGMTQAGDLFCQTSGSCNLPPTGATIVDQRDLLHEQAKLSAGDVALSAGSPKRFLEKAVRSLEDLNLREQVELVPMEQMKKLEDEINGNNIQICTLEQEMVGSVEMSSHTSNGTESYEIKAADNRILQGELQTKIAENTEMQDTILMLRQQLKLLPERSSSNLQSVAGKEFHTLKGCPEELLEKIKEDTSGIGLCEDSYINDNTPTSVVSLNRVFCQDGSVELNNEPNLNSQVRMQAAEIENLKLEKVRLTEEKDGIEIHRRKMEEEASYAKELVAAAAVELRGLAEEVTRLSFENAKLSRELDDIRDSSCRSNYCQRSILATTKKNIIAAAHINGHITKASTEERLAELQKEIRKRSDTEASSDSPLSEKDQVKNELQRELTEARRRERDLENELTNMHTLVMRMRGSGMSAEGMLYEGVCASSVPQMMTKNTFQPANDRSGNYNKEDKIYENADATCIAEDLRACYQKERRRCRELDSLVSRLKGEDITGLDLIALEKLQRLHVDAITKICRAKCANHLI